MQSEFCVKSYSSDYVKGSVDVESDSILYLSIPRQDNWSVYVDGEKVEKISDVNIAFLGVQIPDGKHSVVLKYENKPIKLESISLQIIFLAETFTATLQPPQNKSTKVEISCGNKGSS